MMKHVSEVAHIVRAALDQDREKVRAYAELLVTKLTEDGEDRQAYILNCILYPSLEDISKRIMPTVAMCFDGDIEDRARLLNEGYQEAMKQQTGGDEHRAWLIQIAQEVINQWVETAYQTAMCGDSKEHSGAKLMRHLYLAEPWLPACRIADALLSEIDFDEVCP